MRASCAKLATANESPIMAYKPSGNVPVYRTSEIRDLEHRALDGVMRRGAFDSPVTLNLITGFKPGANWEFSAHLSAATGRPYTPPLEPASALDPLSTTRIEDLIGELRRNYTIIIVTHNMQQAARVSDFTAFFYEGHLIEYDRTVKMFTKPAQKKTEDYITGRFG